ncbi:MAG TPA: DnaJ C-terminal domain-containing protein, partial [Spirochaetota bacterium]|nr:DnaJ C-terminal domain-containing protein [Spirochaetota bacterium]
LIIIVPISFTQAALGDEINVSTLDNKVIKLKIPAGCENGKVLRIKNAGVPVLENPEQRGDLYIKVEIEIPKQLNKEERRILEEYRRVHGENQKPTPKKITGNHEENFDSFF